MSLSKIFKDKIIRVVNKPDGTLKITLSEAPVSGIEKHCGKCHVIKLLTDFSVGKGKCARATYCKTCNNNYHAGYNSGRRYAQGNSQR